MTPTRYERETEDDPDQKDFAASQPELALSIELDGDEVQQPMQTVSKALNSIEHTTYA